MLGVDLGFQPDRAAALQVDFNANDPKHLAMILQRILARVGALPGVTAAGMVDYLPMEQNREWGAPVPEGSGINSNDLPDTLVYVVTPGYFHAMGMSLRGHDFTWDDKPKGPGVIILNETVTRFLYPGQDRSARLSTSTEWIARSLAS